MGLCRNLIELMATHSDVSKCRKQISSFAETLTVRVDLVKEIASLFRPVLYHSLMSLTEEDTLSLLTSEFWVRPVYEELLHAVSRFNLSPDVELKRSIWLKLPLMSNPNPGMQ